VRGADGDPEQRCGQACRAERISDPHPCALPPPNPPPARQQRDERVGRLVQLAPPQGLPPPSTLLLLLLLLLPAAHIQLAAAALLALQLLLPRRRPARHWHKQRDGELRPSLAVPLEQPQQLLQLKLLLTLTICRLTRMCWLRALGRRWFLLSLQGCAPLPCRWSRLASHERARLHPQAVSRRAGAAPVGAHRPQRQLERHGRPGAPLCGKVGLQGLHQAWRQLLQGAAGGRGAGPSPGGVHGLLLAQVRLQLAQRAAQVVAQRPHAARELGQPADAPRRALGQGRRQRALRPHAPRPARKKGHNAQSIDSMRAMHMREKRPCPTARLPLAH
jgi:hypothetical protein